MASVDNTARRKWDREEFQERARKRELEQDGKRKPRETSPPGEKKPLKPRDFDVDLTSRLGKTQVVTQVTPIDQQAGYFCNVCNCVVKDSANYLDHINGKKHQKALGMSMRVERATLKQVQSRFETVKRKKSEEVLTDEGNDYELRALKQQEEEAERKRQRKEKKREKKKEKASEDVEEIDPEVAQAMGFGGFGAKK